MNNARTSTFYLANLGSEVARLQSALAKKDAELSAGALKRTRTIFEKLLSLPLRESARSEIKMLQEVVEDLPKQEHRFSVDTKSLQDYFSPFANLILSQINQ